MTQYTQHDSCHLKMDSLLEERACTTPLLRLETCRILERRSLKDMLELRLLSNRASVGKRCLLCF